MTDLIRRCAVALMLLAWLPAAIAAPSPRPDPLRRGAQTGLALPRFASIRAGVANLRRGPGRRYPIVWVYHRRNLPVLILREFGDWRLLRMPDTTRGWMHRGLLSPKRHFVVTASQAALRSAPRANARAVAMLRQGVVGVFQRCLRPASWCVVQTHDYAGYVPRQAIWGSDADAVRPPGG